MKLLPGKIHPPCNKTPYYKVDVVPYITDISTGDLESGTKKYLRRSASGAFVASVDDTTNENVTVKGFNLKGGTVYLGTISKTTIDGTDLTVTKATIGKSGAIKVRNNSIDSLNNLNNDSAEYNKEVSQFAPNYTDGRYIYMWDNTTKTNYKGVAEAVMKPVIGTNGTKTGEMTWMYVQNNQRVVANGTTLTNSWNIKGGDFAYNNAGTFFYIFLHDMNWNSSYSTYSYNGSVQWSKDIYTAQPAYYWNKTNTNRLGLDNLSYDGDSNYSQYNQQVLSRYQNLQLLADGNNTSTTQFAAYYDKASESQAIVFRTFHVGTGVTQTTSLGRPKEASNGTRWYSDLTKYATRTGNYSNTDGTDVGLQSPLGRVNVVSGENATSYFNMQYDSTRTNVYIAYYDGADGKLKIKYNNSPETTPDTWSDAVEIDESAGQYVKMIVGSDGKINLAYYDATGSYLKYALITPTFNGSNNVTSMTVTHKVLVDTLFTNGMYNSITLKQFGTNDIRPVICSYSISYGGTKYALRTSWPLTTVANIEAGANDDGYTGKWETVVVCSQTAPAQDNTFVETTGAGYTGNIIVGYNGSVIEETTLLPE